MRIGIVEDNQVLREMLEVGFYLAGHEAIGFPGAQELLSALASDGTFPLDALLVDIMLPGDIDGIDLVERLRMQISSDDLQIIFVTGNDLAARRLAEKNRSEPIVMKGTPRLVHQLLSMISHPAPTIARIYG